MPLWLRPACSSISANIPVTHDHMENDRKIKRIVLTGGGTAGSVSPLLAIYEECKSDRNSPLYRADFLFIGSEAGPEKHMAEKDSLRYLAIASGKWRRYFSWRNLTDPFKVLAGFFQSLSILHFYQPDLVITAGSFTSVPAVWAAWLLRIPVLVHQQDIRAGLANKLMAPFSRKITVTFHRSLRDYGSKAEWTGNPTRRSLKIDSMRLDVESANTKPGLPTVLILGGGTGAEAINDLIYNCLSELTSFSKIVHQTGHGKGKVRVSDNYTSFEFLHSKQLAATYASADIIVSRCGMGTLTEICYLRKPAILIPMPDSHQEDNARVFIDHKAAIVFDQNKLTPELFIGAVKNLLSDPELRKNLSHNLKKVMLPDANERMIKAVKEILFGK